MPMLDPMRPTLSARATAINGAATTASDAESASVGWRAMVDLRDLHAFETLAAELHFGRAAVRLGVSQPTLSRYVRRLEHELGVVLAHRTSRTVRLTDAGHELATRPARRPAPARAHARGDARGGRGRLGDLAAAATASRARRAPRGRRAARRPRRPRRAARPRGPPRPRRRGRWRAARRRGPRASADGRGAPRSRRRCRAPACRPAPARSPGRSCARRLDARAACPGTARPRRSPPARSSTGGGWPPEATTSRAPPSACGSRRASTAVTKRRSGLRWRSISSLSAAQRRRGRGRAAGHGAHGVARQRGDRRRLGALAQHVADDEDPRPVVEGEDVVEVAADVHPLAGGHVLRGQRRRPGCPAAPRAAGWPAASGRRARARGTAGRPSTASAMRWASASTRLHSSRAGRRPGVAPAEREHPDGAPAGHERDERRAAAEHAGPPLARVLEEDRLLGLHRARDLADRLPWPACSRRPSGARASAPARRRWPAQIEHVQRARVGDARHEQLGHLLQRVVAGSASARAARWCRPAAARGRARPRSRGGRPARPRARAAARAPGPRAR